MDQKLDLKRLQCQVIGHNSTRDSETRRRIAERKEEQFIRLFTHGWDPSPGEPNCLKRRSRFIACNGNKCNLKFLCPYCWFDSFVMPAVKGLCTAVPREGKSGKDYVFNETYGRRYAVFEFEEQKTRELTYDPNSGGHLTNFGTDLAKREAYFLDQAKGVWGATNRLHRTVTAMSVWRGGLFSGAVAYSYPTRFPLTRRVEKIMANTDYSRAVEDRHTGWAGKTVVLAELTHPIVRAADLVDFFKLVMGRDRWDIWRRFDLGVGDDPPVDLIFAVYGIDKATGKKKAVRLMPVRCQTYADPYRALIAYGRNGVPQRAGTRYSKNRGVRLPFLLAPPDEAATLLNLHRELIATHNHPTHHVERIGRFRATARPTPWADLLGGLSLSGRQTTATREILEIAGVPWPNDAAAEADLFRRLATMDGRPALRRLYHRVYKPLSTTRTTEVDVNDRKARWEAKQARRHSPRGG